MIKKYISFYEFCDNFSESYRHNFSYNGKQALYDYLEELSDDIGEDIELDTVALCCDYEEINSADIPCKAEEYNNFSYSSEDLTEEEKIEEAKEFLQDNTTVIDFSGTEYNDKTNVFEEVSGIIIQSF